MILQANQEYGWSTIAKCIMECVVVEIDRQEKLLHTGSDLGIPDL